VPRETKAYRPPDAAAPTGDKRHFVAQGHLQAAGIDPDRHRSLTSAFCRAACAAQRAEHVVNNALSGVISRSSQR
jgi:hypothetical protein